MNRKGHVGTVLLVVAPIVYILITDGKLALAVLCWLGIHVVEPLPDQDFHLPGVSHRGISHSLLAALIVGVVLGGILWIGSGTVPNTTLLPTSATPLPVKIDLLLFDLLGIGPFTIPEPQIGSLGMTSGGIDRWAAASVGFAVGAGGIIIHLLGDIITSAGVRPLLPFSQWHPSLTSIRTDNTAVNEGLFTVGTLTLIVAIVGAFI